MVINKLFSKQRMRVHKLGSAAVLLPCAAVLLPCAAECSYLWMMSLLAACLEMLEFSFRCLFRIWEEFVLSVSIFIHWRYNSCHLSLNLTHGRSSH